VSLIATPSQVRRRAFQELERLLQSGILTGLKDLKFATYKFENTPQGKLILGIMLSQSKYYIDALAVNIRRGMLAKAGIRLVAWERFLRLSERPKAAWSDAT
jgi:hypothetical protein